MCALLDVAEGLYFFIQCRECRTLITLDPGYYFLKQLLNYQKVISVNLVIQIYLKPFQM